MGRVARLLMRFRVSAACVIGALFLLALTALPGLRFDLSIRPVLEASDERLASIEAFRRRLPSAVADVVVCLDWPEAMTAAELGLVARLDSVLGAVPGVGSSISLASTSVMDSSGGAVTLRSVKELCARGATPLEVAQDHPLLAGRLLSWDGRAAAVLLVAVDHLESREALLEEIERAIARAPVPGARLRLLGGALVEREMNRDLKVDLTRSLALEGLCFVVLLAFLFRTARGVILPLFAVLAALLFYVSLLVVFGLSIKLIEIAIPGLITVIALCDAIHMVERFEEALAEGLERLDAVVAMVERVGLACFFTSFTTALGFLSLLVADHRAVRDFAVSASLGVLTAFATVILVLPVCLSFWPVGRLAVRRPAMLTNFRFPSRVATFVGFAVLSVFSAFGVARLEVDSKWLEEFPSDAKVVQDMRWYEGHFRGLLAFDVWLEGRLDSFEMFETLSSLEAELRGFEEVTSSESLTDWLSELAGQPERFDRAAHARGVAALRATSAFAPARFPGHVVGASLRRGRLRLETKDIGTRAYLALREKVRARLAELPPGLVARVDGYTDMAHESSRLVVTTMVESFAVSLAAITLFMALVFRSPRIALVSVLPNALPIFVALGLTGWLAIPLRIGIVMVYCLGLGLAVDDSIHILARFVEERRRAPGVAPTELLVRSVRTTGRALLTTSIVLFIGSLCYLPSGFRSLNDLGVLLSAIVVVATLADIYMLPVLMVVGGASSATPPKHPAEPREVVPPIFETGGGTP